MVNIIEIYVNNRPLNNPIRAKYCDSFICRLKGFMFRKEISSEEGLILVQKRESKTETSIHMLAVFCDLGVIWIDANFRVVDLILAKSWHLAYFPANPARYTLEIHPDRLTEFKIGDEVSFNEI
jgi:uncharacterized membrane protein (UPF0127 family)